MKTRKQKEKFLKAYRKLCLKHKIVVTDNSSPELSLQWLGWPLPNNPKSPEEYIDVLINKILENSPDQ